MTAEDRLQAACIRWFDLHFPKVAKLLFAIPNGGKRHRRTAVTMKLTGTRAGVADLELLAYGRALFIEVKTPKGKQSATQKEWQELAESQGFEYVIIRNVDEFERAVCKFLNQAKAQFQAKAS
jgi:hypothetical protein